MKMSQPLLPPVPEVAAEEGSTSSSSFSKAAALICQVMSGHNIPLMVAKHKDYERAINLYLLYQHYSPLKIVVYILLSILPFFQEPPWCNKTSTGSCQDINQFPSSGMIHIPASVSLFIEVICFVGLAWLFNLQYRLRGPSVLKKRAPLCKIILLMGMVIGMLQTAMTLLDVNILQQVRISLYIQAFVPLIFSRTLRRTFFMILRIIPSFMDIVVLLGLFVLSSAWLATCLFQKHAEFHNYPTALLNLFILLTTSNSPEVWTPVYTTNHFSFIFFFCYLIIGLFFLMNLLISVIYSNYKLQMVTEVKRRRIKQKANVHQAFDILDVHKQQWIDAKTMTNLFLAIFRYRNLPDDRARRTHLFLALDKRGDFRIWADEFEEIINAITNELVYYEDAYFLSERGNSNIESQNFIQRVIRHTGYKYLKMFASFCSLCIALCDIYLQSRFASLGSLRIVEFCFGWLFAVDDILTALTISWKPYKNKCVNLINSFLTICTIFLSIFGLSVPGTSDSWICILLIGRTVLFLASLNILRRWILMGQTLLRLIPATLPILNIQYTLCSLFSLIGVELFGGLIFFDNPRLEGTSYSQLKLWHLNYNDFTSAMVTNFSLCVVNNWPIITDAFVAATGNRWARVYFIGFWTIIVAFTLNVVVSLFVNAFTHQMEKSHAMKEENRKSIQEKHYVNHFAGVNEQQSYVNMRKTLSCYDLYADLTDR